MRKKELGLYIHIPFCKSKCTYCDFYSIIFDKDLIKKYLICLEKEIQFYAANYGKDFFLNTIYIGGGTPSILDAIQIDSLLNIVNKNFEVKKGAEITIEMNPESINQDHLLLFKNKIVNRLSLGIQSFNNYVLKTIKRLADKEKILSVIKQIQKYQIDNFSFDLIFGLPYQNFKIFKNDLKMAMDYFPPHLSLYSLMLNTDTPLYDFYLKNRNEFPLDNEIVRYYEYADNYLSKHKLLRYEISNFSHEGYESKHNLKYWLQKPYLGLGVSAVSTVNLERWKNPDDISSYFKTINMKKMPIKEKLDNITFFNEKIMLNLRLTKGMKIGINGEKFLLEKQELIDEMLKQKLIVFKDKYLCLTVKGIMVSNEIISQLFI